MHLATVPSSSFLQRVTTRCQLFGIALAITSTVSAGTLVGHALAAGSGQPLRGVLVKIEALSATAVTDSDGNFRLPSVPAGHYTLTGPHLGHTPATVSPQETYAGRSNILRYSRAFGWNARTGIRFRY